MGELFYCILDIVSLIKNSSEQFGFFSAKGGR